MAFRTNKMPVLQEKSASGAVASFNTALAMPLASCNIAVNAWQEGSGDPSPDNVRTINGWSAIGVSATGKNLYCKTATNTNNGYIDNSVLDTNGEVASNTSYCISEYIPVRGGEDITIQGLIGDRVYVCYYNANKEYIGQGRYSRYTERTYSLPSATAYIRASVPKENIDVFQIEYGDMATSYEAFDAHYFIQIGSTVYGGEYDARTGVLRVTYGVVDLGSISWTNYSTYFLGNFLYKNAKGTPSSNVPFNGLCEYYKVSFLNDTNDNIITMSNNGTQIYTRDNDHASDSGADYATYLSGKKLVYELDTPTTIQLPPCPIETLIGNNTIFADTGDIDLTYKDLDIAKRGNFREVFKLPS